MNKIYNILGIAIIIVGALGLILGLGPYSEVEPVSGYTARLVVFLWGILLVLCGKNYYQGGFYSIIGSIIIGIGILALVRSLEIGYFGSLGDEYGIALVYFLIFSSGIMLLIRGHKLHIKKTEKKLT